MKAAQMAAQAAGGEVMTAFGRPDERREKKLSGGGHEAAEQAVKHMASEAKKKGAGKKAR